MLDSRQSPCQPGPASEGAAPEEAWAEASRVYLRVAERLERGSRIAGVLAWVTAAAAIVIAFIDYVLQGCAAVGCFVSGAQRPWLRLSGWTCVLGGSAVGGALLAGVV